MDWNAEIETDDVTEDELDEYALQYNTCNGFAFWYVENHENAVVRDGVVEGFPGAHCYVYDADRGVTIDPTLGQFDGLPDVGAWDGDTHPYVAEWEVVEEWEDRETFENHYAELGMESPYIVD